MNNITHFVDPCETHSENMSTAAVLACVAAFSIALGLNLQKYSPKAHRVFFVYAAGLLVLISGVVLYFYAYTFAPEVFTVPFLSLSIVFNLILARWINEERFEMEVSIYGFSIFAGCLFTSISAAVCHHEEVLDHVLLIAYSVPLGLIGMLCVFVVLRMHYRLADKQKHEINEKWLKLAYPMLAGTLFSFATLVCRIAFLDTMLRSLYYLSVVLSIAGLIVLQDALVRFDAWVIISIFISILIMLVLIGGGMVFGEFQDFMPVQSGFFVIGIVLVFLGSMCMVMHHDPTPATHARLPNFTNDVEEELETLGE